MDELAQIAHNLIASPKGILAADESLPTIEKRFKTAGIVSSEETRRSYREMLFTTIGIEEYIGGIILFAETTRQKTKDGRLFIDIIVEKGIIPGIKVDEGMESFPESPNEKVTKGLEGLVERLKSYQDIGVKFTKWRAAFAITDLYPSFPAIKENCRLMAEYAKLSQQSGFVSIVEPEILMDGAHTTTRCEEITTGILKELFVQLENSGVSLSGLILKTNMILPGKDGIVKAEPLEVAHATLRTLKSAVPKQVPAVVFLSGGQSPSEATANLNEIEKLKGDTPWELSFSFARALQGPALEVWGGRQENLEPAQKEFLRRASLVSLARQGLYNKDLENEK